jgi:hypothetical protein
MTTQRPKSCSSILKQNSANISFQIFFQLYKGSTEQLKRNSLSIDGLTSLQSFWRLTTSNWKNCLRFSIPVDTTQESWTNFRILRIFRRTPSSKTNFKSIIVYVTCVPVPFLVKNVEKFSLGNPSSYLFHCLLALNFQSIRTRLRKSKDFSFTSRGYLEGPPLWWWPMLIIQILKHI